MYVNVIVSAPGCVYGHLFFWALYTLKNWSLYDTKSKFNFSLNVITANWMIYKDLIYIFLAKLEYINI